MPNISISIVDKQPALSAASILAVPVYEKADIAAALAPAVVTSLRKQFENLGFTGQWADSCTVIAPPSLKASFIAGLGLGAPNASGAREAEGMRRAIGRVLQEARRHGVRELSVAIPDAEHAPLLAAAVVESAELSDYRFVEHRKALRKEQQQRSLKKLTIIVAKQHLKAAQTEAKQAQAVMKGVTLARQLVDQPASHASPTSLVEAAEKIADSNQQIEITVFDKNEAARRGFNAFLAVARGSVQDPYVIHLTYRPKEEAKHHIALVGKGVTFDSGGLSLKPSQYMTDMKVDMAGAATVLGIFSVIEKMKLPVEVHGIIAACENMPSGDAYRPGDVVAAMNGKTIEIQNTDAEGRVTLADALSYAIKQPVDAVIDLATLTGACVVALGDNYAGLWSNSAALRKQLLDGAKQSGEGAVGMPLPEEYRQFIQSKVADVTNSPSNPMGSAITAALFLQEFVGKKPWAHFDIAGPAYISKPILPYYTPGATGYGVRMLISYLQSLANQE